MTMETNLNWGKLYESGRCRSVGVSWNDAELKALAEGVPARYVRIGVMSIEDYNGRREQEKLLEEKPLIEMSKDELLVVAHSKGIPATIAADVETIIRLIEEYKEPVVKEEPKPKDKLKGRRKTK